MARGSHQVSSCARTQLLGPSPPALGSRSEAEVLAPLCVLTCVSLSLKCPPSAATITPHTHHTNQTLAATHVGHTNNTTLAHATNTLKVFSLRGPSWDP